MSLLLLGGTSEGVSLAHDLYVRRVELVYSIAGLVRQPELPCTVISGGFSGIGGLEDYVKHEEISLILDATHPYASQMSAHASDAARAAGIPCWRFHRPAWLKQQGDNWHEFESWKDLAPALAYHEAVLFTAGRLSQEFVDSLYQWTRETVQKQWVRSATKPDFKLPPSMTWIEAIGPYTIDGERELMKKYKIDAVISKNSGGDHAIAKLEVARERQIPIYMLKRPALPDADREFANLDACRNAVLEFYGLETGDAG